MSPNALTDDPDRFALAHELHARPFPSLTAPGRAVFLALRPEGGETRDADADLARLIALIDKHGGAHPGPGARHWSGPLGRGTLKWESHTEFVTYTLFLPGLAATPFSGDGLSAFPADWLAGLGGRIVASARVRIEAEADVAAAEAGFAERLAPHFAEESLAAGLVVDDEALVASDFRLHEDGMARIAVIAVGDVAPDRLGRVVQRVLEVEAYKSAALLTLPVARRVARSVSEIEARLADLSRGSGDDARAALNALSALSEEVESLSTETAFRFGAAEAYAAIVADRIEVLRERRLAGRQLYSEFMKRRFDPAMRTCLSAAARLSALSQRVARATALLSARVQVAVEAQNQKLLESMDKRAAAQLRLQQTVEGLSVVAISYYAVGLALYALKPLGRALELDAATLAALLTPLVVSLVWLGLRRLKRSHQSGDKKRGEKDQP